jgi:cobalt-zinc-cadmium efflux system outer membrane protein
MAAGSQTITAPRAPQPAASVQQARPISLTEAMRLAQSASLTARQANAKVAGAVARLQGAGAPPNPVLSLAQPFGQNTGGLDEDVLLTQTYELGDKRRQRVRAARAEQSAAIADLADTGTSIQLAAESAYFDALRADAEQKLAQETLATARAFQRTAEAQFTAGDVAHSNVVRSEVEVIRAQQALDAAQTDRENRYATLRSLMGLPAGAPVLLTDSLAYVPHEYSLEYLRALALRTRPDLASARQTLEAKRALLHGAKTQSTPDLFVEARHSTLDPTAGGSSVRVGVTLPLLDLGRNRAEVKSARAAVDEQEATLAELERIASLEVETAFRTFEQSRRAVASFEGGRLARSRELLDMAQTGYQHGANTYLELLDAQQVYRAEQAEYTRALAAYNTALAMLRHVVGGTLQ